MIVTPNEKERQEGQTEFSLMDESRLIAYLHPDLNCPACNSMAFIESGHFGVERFLSYRIRCQCSPDCQQPMPNPPAKTAHEACQAWRVYVTLAKTVR